MPAENAVGSLVHVTVVGAGVLGLALAGELAASGADVTVLEQSTAGSGTTGESYAWVNSNGKSPRSYFELNLAGLREFHRQDRNLGGAFVACGHLEVATEPATASDLASRVAQLAEAGSQAELVTSATANRLEPGLDLPAAVAAIAYFRDEGYCDVTRLIGVLSERANQAGALIREHSRVADVTPTRAGADVVLDSGVRISSDRVVLCTGRWSVPLTAAVGCEIPMVDPEPIGSKAAGLLAITQPVRTRVRRLVSTPRLNLRPYPAARLMLQAVDLDPRAGTVRRDSSVKQEITDRARALLPRDRDLRLASVLLGRRALTADGLTVAGWLDTAHRVYALVTHSGVTLSLLLSRLVCAEVSADAEHTDLEPFRPNRFTPS